MRAWITLLVVSAACASPSLGQAAQDDVATRKAEVIALHADLIANHPEPFAHARAEELAAARDRLIARIPDLDRPQYIFEAGRLIAMLEDGHTNLLPPAIGGEGFDSAYPIQLQQFSEGIYAVRLHEELKRMAGRRIVAINGVPAEEALERISAVAGGDNRLGRSVSARLALMVPGFVYGAGLSTDPEAPLVLAMADSGSVEVQPVPWQQADPRQLASISSLLHPGRPVPSPFAPGANIEMRRLDEGRAVLVTYRAVSNEGGPEIAQFARELEAELREAGTERLIFDIRANGGGDNSLNQPLVHAAIRATKINRRGQLYVLIGRETFSAAMNFASSMERETQALFVGEPTGAAPNHFGDAETVRFPDTGLTYRRSTLFWQDSWPSDTRRWIMPDIAVPPTFGHLREGRDPALEAALSHRAASAVPMAPVHRWRRPSQEVDWPFP